MGSASSPSSSSSSDLNSQLFRLESNVVPLRYDLEFTPHPQRSTYTAKAAILFAVRNPSAVPTRQLVLHALHLTLTTSAICLYPVERGNVSGGAADEDEDAYKTAAMGPAPFSVPRSQEEAAIACVAVEHHADTSETCRLTFARPLPNGVGDRFVLLISSFASTIHSSDESFGLYHSCTRDRGTLATHLEPSNARRLYPCYDEPCFSSVFCLAVVADAAYTVISNSAVDHDAPIDGGGEGGDALGPQLRRVVFLPTPAIHSCIMAFAMGRFQMVEQQSRKRGVLCRVVFSAEQPQHAGWFSLDLLAKALDFFDDFFDVALPLQKVDLVAVEEFCSLGMENYGLITILSDFLLVTETTTLERRQRITRLIGHEVCHHWFGDYAAVEFWHYLWLKEGMCRYLEYFFTDAVNPSWGMWNHFIGSIAESALVADANPATTHAVQFCDPRPRHILSSFDTISYAKGAMLLRMLFTIIDISTLKRAAHLLMTRHRGGCFGIVQFAAAIHDAHDEVRTRGTEARRTRVLQPALASQASTGATPATSPTTASMSGGDETEQDLHALIDSVLALAQVPGHPYILVEVANCSPDDKGSGGGGNPTYRITQFHMPLLHRGILPYYVRQQRQRHGPTAIDLLTPPVSTSFEWEPAKALRGVTEGTAFTVPIRVLEIAALQAHNPCNSAANTSFTSNTANTHNSNSSNANHTAPRTHPHTNTNARGSGDAGATPAFLSTVHTVLLTEPTQLYESRPLSLPPEPLRPATAKPDSTPSALPGTDTTPSTSLSPSLSNPTATATTTTTMTPPSRGGLLGGSVASPFPRRHFYFNYGGSGAFHCDFDMATWQRVFELAPSLTDEDRMTITTTLTRLRNVNIGHFPHEDDGSDRCTLFLEWLMVVTQSPALMNSFLWEYITQRLEELVYMTQNAYCSKIFCDFVSSIYLPLHQRCLLSFFPQERTVNFQSHLHLSRSTVASIMHVLALCGSPLILRESQEVATWALSAIYPNRSFDFTSSANENEASGQGGATTGGGGSSASPMGSSVTVAVERPLAESVQGLGISGSANSGSASLSASGGGGATLLGASPPRPYLAGPLNAPPTGATHLDFTNEAHSIAITDALRYLVQRGDTSVWAATAGLAASATRVDTELVERDMSLTIPALSTPFSPITDMPKLVAVLPAFFTLDDDSAFEFMADVLRCVSRVATRVVMALLRNTRFLGYLLETRRSNISQWWLRSLIAHGATLCSNGHVITLFKASVLYQESARQGGVSGNAAGNSPDGASAASSAYSEYRAIDFMDDGVGGDSRDTALKGGIRASASGNNSTTTDEGGQESPAHSTRDGSASQQQPQPKKRKLLSPELALAFDVMECNCVWMDYCGDHFERFLREQRAKRTWLPCDNQLDSRCTPLATDLTASDGSPLVTMGPDGSSTYQGPVGGISI